MEKGVKREKNNIIMDEKLEEIFDYYVEDYMIESFSYKMMGQLLELNKVKKRLEMYKIQELYIYGGGYLGIQLYNAVKNFAFVKSIVDKKGSISLDVQGIKVISLEDLQKKYINEKIIITPVKYYKVIEKDLISFIKRENILFLGEFLEGVI